MTTGVLRSYTLEARFEFTKLLRLPAYVLPTFAFPMMFYAFFANVLNHSAGGGADPSGARELLANCGAFGVIAAALFGFGVSLAVERGQGWLLLKRASPMPSAAYLLAKLASALAFALAIGIAMELLAATYGNVRMPAAAWVTLLVVLALGSIPFCALGMALGMLAGPNSAPAIVNVVYLPLSFAGGLWLPMDELPAFFVHLAPWLPTYHLGRLALASVGAAAFSAVDALALAGFTVVFLALAAIGWQRDEGKLYG